ncbi:hypothetical protein RB213_002132 [Colletotrichum asianum]
MIAIATAIATATATAIATAKQTSSTNPLLIRLRWRLYFTPSKNHLPTNLNIKLRVNRKDLSLLDNYKQI